MVDARGEQAATPEGPYAETFSLMFELLLASPYFRGISIANFLFSLVLLLAGVILIAQTAAIRRGEPPGERRLTSIWWSNQATLANACWCIADGVHQGWVMLMHRDALVASFSRSAQAVESSSEVSATVFFVTTLAMVGLRALVGTAFFLWLGYRVRDLARRMRGERESDSQS